MAQAAEKLPEVRHGVRALLLSSPAYLELDADERRSLAQALVTVCHAAVSLGQEQAGSTAPGRTPTLAMAQSAQSQFGGVATDRIAGTTKSILNAVSFPRFVTELINGVFKALIDSNQQQMRAYMDLIRNVAASTEDFADANMGPGRARAWLVQAFPGSYEMDGSDDQPKLRLKDGAHPPSDAELKTSIGLGPAESVPSGDPDTALVPLVQRNLAGQRQQMLASMVMLGMQRIVIESGRLNAAMRFHIDTRSAAATDEGSTFDEHNVASVSAKVGFGLWSAEANMTNTIGYVSTEKNQTTESMDTSVDLNSSVELVFKTDYLPLDRMAKKDQADRIRVNTINPDAEVNAAVTERRDRQAADVRSDAARRGSLDAALKPAPPPASVTKPPPAKTPAPAPAITTPAPAASAR